MFKLYILAYIWLYIVKAVYERGEVVYLSGFNEH